MEHLPMHPVCALVFASLCISQHDLEITSTFSMVVMKNHGFSPEAVKRRGVEIDAMESDSFHGVNGLFMDRACSEGGCLNYTRHCEETVCKFEVTAPPFRETGLRGDAAIGTSFEIHARTRAQLHAFMKTLIVALGDSFRKPVGYMPLERLSGGEKPLFRCSSVVWYQGCSRPRLPMKPRPDRV